MRRPTPMGAPAVRLTVEVAPRSYITRVLASSPGLDRMVQTPLRRDSRSRRVLVRLVWIAWALAIIATALGFTAGWIAVFDLINQARPIHLVIALVLFAAAIALREPPLIRPTAALAMLQVGLLLLPWARAADTAAGAAPALRLVTFDLGADNNRFDDIADFLLGAGADVVLLQDVSCSAADRLIPKLKTAFPTTFVSAETCAGQALLS